MGGAVGHLMHLYDDPDLTFGEIKEILESASQGQLEEATEKLDGRNIVFTWDAATGHLRVARASGDITRGGMDAVELARKFQGRGSLETAFNTAFHVLATAAGSLSLDDQEVVFGSAGNRWYSAEIIFASDPNVINYDSNTVVFHGQPVFEVIAGRPQPVDYPLGIEILSANIDQMMSSLRDTDWSVQGPVVAVMEAVSDGSVLQRAVSGLDEIMMQHGLNDSSTIGDYTAAALTRFLEKRGFSGAILDALLARLMRSPGAPDLRRLKQMAPHLAQQMDSVVKSEERVMTGIMLPLDRIIGEFAADVLSTLKSALIGDNPREVARLQAATDTAIEQIRASGDPKAVAYLDQQLSRLGSTSNIRSPVEGIVFRWRGKTYKFTGAFAAANQILGLMRYQKPRAAAVTDTSTLDEAILRAFIKHSVR
jgi:hypothetical protein